MSRVQVASRSERSAVEAVRSAGMPAGALGGRRCAIMRGMRRQLVGWVGVCTGVLMLDAASGCTYSWPPYEGGGGSTTSTTSTSSGTGGTGGTAGGGGGGGASSSSAGVGGGGLGCGGDAFPCGGSTCCTRSQQACLLESGTDPDCVAYDCAVEPESTCDCLLAQLECPHGNANPNCTEQPPYGDGAFVFDCSQ